MNNYTYKIGNGKSLTLGKNDNLIRIRHKGAETAVVFTPARWASFRLCFDELDNQLCKLSGG